MLEVPHSGCKLNFIVGPNKIFKSSIEQFSLKNVHELWAQEIVFWGDTAHTLWMGGTIGVGTPHNIERKSKFLNQTGWSLRVGRSGSNRKQAQLGAPHSRIQVELGFILQAGTCQILSLAENPRWSRMWQYQGNKKSK